MIEAFSIATAHLFQDASASQARHRREVFLRRRNARSLLAREVRNSTIRHSGGNLLDLARRTGPTSAQASWNARSSSRLHSYVQRTHCQKLGIGPRVLLLGPEAISRKNTA